MHINLPQPCSENWQKMTLDEKGRHCQKCDKVVHDFTSYSDTELIDFFKSGTKVCGRFSSAQIGRSLDHSSISTSKWAIAACSLLMILSNDIQAQNEFQITKDSGIQTQVLNPIQLSRVVRVRFEKAISHETSISRMRLKMPGFSIDTLVDSTNMLSISIPSQYNNYLAEVDLYNHLGDSFHFTSVTFGLGEIGFTNASGVWSIIPLTILPFNFPIYPQITMGIPAPITLFDYPATQVVMSSTDTFKGYPISDTLLTDKPDTSPRKSVSKVIPVKHTKKRLPTGLIIGCIGAVLGLVVFAFRKFRRRPQA